MRPEANVMLAWFLGLSSLAEVIEGVIALAIYHQAFRFYRLSGEKSLLRISTAFLVLGLGLLTHGLALGAMLFILAGRFSSIRLVVLLSRLTSLTLFGCEALAYGSLAFSYARAGGGGETSGTGQRGPALGALASLAQSPILARPGKPLGPEFLIRFVRYHPFMEVVILALLAYLTYKTISNFLRSRDVNPFLVGFAFLLLTVAHLCFLLSYFLTAFYITAHVLQLLAFISMCLLLVRVAGLGEAEEVQV